MLLLTILLFLKEEWAHGIVNDEMVTMLQNTCVLCNAIDGAVYKKVTNLTSGFLKSEFLIFK
jgi:hypothetical protein